MNLKERLERSNERMEKYRIYHFEYRRRRMECPYCAKDISRHKQARHFRTNYCVSFQNKINEL